MPNCNHPLNALYPDPDDLRASVCGVCGRTVKVRLPPESWTRRDPAPKTEGGTA